MHCVMSTLQDARGDIWMVRGQEHDKTFEHIHQQYQANEENNQFAPNRGRGYIHCADCYFTQRFLKKEWE